jgi:hypothetical protein
VLKYNQAHPESAASLLVRSPPIERFIFRKVSLEDRRLVAGLRCGLAVGDPYFDLPRQGHDLFCLVPFDAMTSFLLGGFLSRHLVQKPPVASVTSVENGRSGKIRPTLRWDSCLSSISPSVPESKPLSEWSKRLYLGATYGSRVKLRKATGKQGTESWPRLQPRSLRRVNPKTPAISAMTRWAQCLTRLGQKPSIESEQATLVTLSGPLN